MRTSGVALLVVLAAGAGGCTASSRSARPGPYPLYNAQPTWAESAPQPGYPPQPSVYRPVNLAALQGLLGTRCAPREVAPGEFATLDCGLSRLVSRAIAFIPKMAIVTGPLPLAVDHRASGTEGPIKSQGAVGACTAFSLSSTMDNAVRRLGRGDVIAPLHVWSKYAVPEMGTAGDETMDKTITLEPSWPYDPAKACKLNRDPTDSCGRAYSVSARQTFSASTVAATSCTRKMRAPRATHTSAAATLACTRSAATARPVSLPSVALRDQPAITG